MSLRLDHVVIVRDAFRLEVDAVLDGRCTAVLGPSGCGKTTLLEAIIGLVKPRSGRIAVDGEIVSDASVGGFVRTRQRRIGYVPQEGALFPHLSVRENLMFGSHGRPMEAEPVIAMLELGDLIDRRVPGLSGGEKRRVALGRALLSGPRLLLLDEPLTGLDRARKEQAADLLRRVRDEGGIPLVLVTHDEREVEMLAEGLLVLG